MVNSRVPGKRMTIVAAAAVAASCSPLPLPQPTTPYGHLLVIVRDATTGKTIREPMVLLMGIHLCVIGDRRGRVCFEKIAPGMNRVMFLQPGMQRAYDSVEVRPWRTDTLVLTTVYLDSIALPEIAVLTSASSIPNGLAIYRWTSGTAAVPQAGPLVETSRLLPASPNPFAPATKLEFSLDVPGKAELEIFDVSGRLVRRFIEPSLAPGAHMVEWAGDNEAGHRLPAGTYFYILKVNGRVLGPQKAVMLQ